jgi:hypothetical protein
MFLQILHSPHKPGISSLSIGRSKRKETFSYIKSHLRTKLNLKSMTRHTHNKRELPQVTGLLSGHTFKNEHITQFKKDRKYYFKSVTD